MYQICLVEDEPYIIEAMRYLFEAEGWQVHVISDGAAAVDGITKLQPSVLILDYMLPNQSGLSIAKALRAKPEMAELPILMLTAKGQEKDKQQAQLAGIQHFMTKPFANDALVELVKSLLPAAPEAE